MIFTKKYEPKKVDNLFTEKEKILQLKKAVLERRPVIINGPTGCGKTCLVHVLAKELNYEVLELNASESRNKANLEGVLGPGSKEGSLFFRGRLILVDDVEALSGTKDRGGLPTLISFLEESKWPIVFTTSDISDFKFSKLKSKCSLIELEKVKDIHVFELLKKICEKEHIIYDPLVLRELAEISKGDIRSAINDLQSLSSNKQLDSLEEVGKRERKEDILNSLKTIFKSKEINKVINVFNEADVDLDEALLWLDENIPREYLEVKDLNNAYDSLSKSDVFNGRIRKWQYWRFLVYRNFFLTGGISLAKSRDYLSYQSYKRSGRLLKLFWARQRNMKKKAIAEKISVKMHCSNKRALHDFIPYLQIIYRHGETIDDVELSTDEIEWLRTE